MATKTILIAIAALALLAITTTIHAKIECCPSYFRSYHVCLGLPNERPIKIAKPTGTYLDYFWVTKDKKDESAPKCLSLFCEDGSDAAGKYCGVGPCGPFGCNCVGGCRKGNGTGYETFRRAWLKKHELVREARHKFERRVVQFE